MKFILLSTALLVAGNLFAATKFETAIDAFNKAKPVDIKDLRHYYSGKTRATCTRVGAQDDLSRPEAELFWKFDAVLGESFHIGTYGSPAYDKYLTMQDNNELGFVDAASGAKGFMYFRKGVGTLDTPFWIFKSGSFGKDESVCWIELAK